MCLFLDDVYVDSARGTGPDHIEPGRPELLPTGVLHAVGYDAQFV
jgi:hypothetical protein